MTRAMPFILLLLTIAGQGVADESAWPEFKPPHLNATNNVCKFPDRVSEIIVGGHGRFLIARLPSLYCLAVIDLNTLQITGYIRLQHPEQIVVAGSEFLLLVDGEKRHVQRWSLKTLKPLGKSMTLPGEGTVLAVAMGYATNGPLLVVNKPVGDSSDERVQAAPVFHDGTTLQPLDAITSFADTESTADWGETRLIRASGNGRLFSVFGPNMLLQLAGKTVVAQKVEMSVDSLPGAFGRMFYQADQQIDVLKPLRSVTSRNQRSSSRSRRVPVIGWPGSVGLTHNPSNRRTSAAVWLDGVSSPVAIADMDGQLHTANRKPTAISSEVWAVPSAKVVARLESDRNSMSFVALDVEHSMQKLRRPLLAIALPSPVIAEPSETVTVKPKLYSNRHPVSMQLSFGPEGMHWDQERGVLSWNVPEAVDNGIVEATMLAKAEGISQSQQIAFRVVGGNDKNTTSQQMASIPLKVYSGEKSAKAKTVAGDPLTSDTAEILLPAPALTNVSEGGEGRFLVLRLSKINKLAIVDFSRAELTGLLPDSEMFAAGGKAVFLINKVRGTLERWGLESLQLEKSVSLAKLYEQSSGGKTKPSNQVNVTSLSAGTSADETLLMGFGGSRSLQPVTLVDAQTLQTLPSLSTTTRDALMLNRLLDSRSNESNDGCVFWPKFPRRGNRLTILSGPQFGVELIEARRPEVMHDGQGSRLDRSYAVLHSPSAGPALRLLRLGSSRQPSWGAQLVDQDYQVITDAPTVRIEHQFSQTLINQLHQGNSGWFRPNYKLAATLLDDRQKLEFFRVDVEKLLKQASNVPPLVVSSQPIVCEAGAHYEYDIKLFSPEHRPTFTLKSAPAGMQVDAAGKVTWHVPDDPETNVFYPLVMISDAKGKSTNHRLTIIVPNYARIQIAKKEAEQRRRLEEAVMLRERQEKAKLARRQNQIKLATEIESAKKRRQESWQLRRTTTLQEDDAWKPLRVQSPIPADKEARLQRISAENLRLIATGLQGFRQPSQTRSSQHPVVAENEGLSWRVHLLPYLGYGKLYSRFNRAEPWYSETNSRLIAEMPDVYRVPGTPAESGRTSYLAVNSDESMPWPNMLGFIHELEARRIASQRRGIRPSSGKVETIDIGKLKISEPAPTMSPVVVEADHSAAVTWTRPLDFDVKKYGSALPLFGLRNAGTLLITKAGEVEVLRKQTSHEILGTLFSGTLDAGLNRESIFDDLLSKGRRTKSLPNLRSLPERVFVPGQSALTARLNVEGLRQHPVFGLALPLFLKSLPKGALVFDELEMDRLLATQTITVHRNLGHVVTVIEEDKSNDWSSILRALQVASVRLQRWPVQSSGEFDWRVDYRVLKSGVAVFRQPGLMVISAAGNYGFRLLGPYLSGRADPNSGEWVKVSKDSLLDVFYRPDQAVAMLSSLSSDADVRSMMRPLWQQTTSGRFRLELNVGVSVQGKILLKPDADSDAVLQACNAARDALALKWYIQSQEATSPAERFLPAFIVHLLRSTSFTSADGSISVTSNLPVDLLQKAIAGKVSPNNEVERDLAGKKEVRRKLKQLHLAMHAFHNKHGRFPASREASPGGKQFHSWRVALLPYIDDPVAKNLHQQYRFNEAWNSDHNSQLTAEMPDVFRHPNPPTAVTEPNAKTCFVGFVGPETALGEKTGIRFRDIRDGTANTLMLIEHQDFVPWAKPYDLPFEPTGEIPQLPDGNRPPFHAAFCDGSVYEFSPNVPEVYLHLLIDRQDGQALSQISSVHNPFYGEIK